MTPSDPSDSGPRIRPWTIVTWLCAVVIVIACAGTFGLAARNGILHWDDRYHTIENPWFASIQRDSFTHFWAEPYGNLYIPVAYNFFAAEIWLTQQFTGTTNLESLDPTFLQLSKLALHAAAAILAFALIRRIVASDLLALLGALLFALHPLQTESVAWISETRGLLGSVFGLASILTLERCCRDFNSPPSLAAERSALLRASARVSDSATVAAWWFISSLLLAAALLSKPSTVTVPVVAAAWLWAIHVPARRIALCTGPQLALCAAAVIITKAVQAAEVIPHAPQWWQRPLIAADAICFYVYKLVWPVSLAPDYGRTPQHVLAVWNGWWAWLALLIVACGLVVVARSARNSRVMLFAIVVPLAALLPVLGFATFHHQDISTVADRYAYLALLGPAVLVAHVLSGRKLAWHAAIAALVLACGLLSFRQVLHWKSDETLWTHAIVVNPASPVAHNNLGRELQRQGRIADAEPHLVRAAELDPESADVLVNLGEIRAAQGRNAEAVKLYERAIELAPRNIRPRIDLGIELAQAGRDVEAAAMLQSVIDIDPKQSEALINLAVLDLRAGRREAASSRLEAVLAGKPHHPLALHNLALVRASQERWKDAAELWGLAIGVGMRSLDIYLRRGDAFVRAGMLDEAEHAYLETTSAFPNAYEPWNNLGLVHIRRGEFESAVSAFAKAVSLAPEADEPRDNLAAARRLLQERK